MTRRIPIETRIRASFTVAENGCWVWHKVRDTSGYGSISVYGSHRMAHRVAYETFVGPIPSGLELDHLCRNRACVNPDHLEPVTHAENMRRAPKVLVTECPQGHPYDAANTYVIVRRNGGRDRSCRACNREATRRYRDRRAATRKAETHD